MPLREYERDSRKYVAIDAVDLNAAKDLADEYEAGHKCYVYYRETEGSIPNATFHFEVVALPALSDSEERAIKRLAKQSSEEPFIKHTPDDPHWEDDD